IFGVETNLRLTDEELAIRFADVVQSLGGKIPSRKRFQAIARMSPMTLTRGASWTQAKLRVINVYFGLPACDRKGEEVDAALRKELSKLNGMSTSTGPVPPTAPAIVRHAVQVPAAYVSLVRDFRGRGEEEKRQLVAQ